jgi:ParB family chromosome partitioning protein
MKNIGNQIKSIALKKLVTHPDNPNRMSKANFSKLVRNIEQTGRYEPLLVRPHPDKAGCFQIINGCHRYQALKELRYKTANVVVWNIDDHQTDILLASINRLSGTDVLDKKLELLRKLNSKLSARELAKLLPATSKQIEKLATLMSPKKPAPPPIDFAQPLVFFVRQKQKKIIEEALSIAEKSLQDYPTKAERKAAALAVLAGSFLAARTADEIKQYFATELTRKNKSKIENRESVNYESKICPARK